MAITPLLCDLENVIQALRERRSTLNEDHDLEALRAVYRATDAALDGWSCALSRDCCHFARTGREPYLWPNEWALLQRALASRGVRKGGLAVLPGGDGACPLLSAEGRCTVYADRPFGCRTYYCEQGVGPTRRPPRSELVDLGRQVAALSREGSPSEGPRALSSLLASWKKREK